MRVAILLFLLAGGLIGCSRSPEMPRGISLRISSSNEVILTLDEGATLQVRQNKPDARIALVSHLDGKLQVIQLEKGGQTPRSLSLISRDKATFVVESQAPGAILIDEDGDGLPDLKMEGGKKFRRGSIEWIEIPKKDG